MVLVAAARAALTMAASPWVCDGLSHEKRRRAWVTLSLPGRPDQSVHFVEAATARAALMASHSLGETTATRLDFVTMAAVGNCFLSRAPTEIKVEPSEAGRTMRAWSMPGSAMSQLHCVRAVILSGVPGMGYEVPMILYWGTGLMGGSPVTVRPSRPVTPTH